MVKRSLDNLEGEFKHINKKTTNTGIISGLIKSKGLKK